MGRHAKPGLGAGQLASIAVAGAVVAGAAGAAIVRMAGGGDQPFAPASSAVTAAPSPAPAAGPPAAGATAAPEPPPSPYPRTAVSTVAGRDGELLSTRIVAGGVTRVLSGLRPVRWFADGTVLLQAVHGPRETVVYDPVAGRYVARHPYLYGPDGLAPTPGPGAAPQSFFAPPAEGDRTLVEVSSHLVETRTRLPRGHPRRTYRPDEAVRVGDAVFVPYGRARDDRQKGVLRLGGERRTTILEGRHVERLAVSSDYRHLLALVRLPGAPGGADGLRIMSIDPDTGAVLRRLRLPLSDGRRTVRIGLFDKVGPRYAVQAGRTCRAGAPAACQDGPLRTWRWEGGRWSVVAGSADRVVLWQSTDARVSWTLPDGPVYYSYDGRRRELHTNSKQGVRAPGGLLRPA